MDTDKHGFRNTNGAGARLCPQDQPQRVDSSDAFEFSGVLRLVFDTAALRKQIASACFPSVCICGHPWFNSFRT